MARYHHKYERGKNQQEIDERRYYKDFSGGDNDDGENRISLQAIAVNCHDRIYKVKDFSLDADFPEMFNIGKRVFAGKKIIQIVGIGSRIMWLRSG